MGDSRDPRLNDDSQSSTESQPVDELAGLVSRARTARQERAQNRNQRSSSNERINSITPSEVSTHSNQLKYGAKSVIGLFIPVSICIGLVIGTMKATDQYKYSALSTVGYGPLMMFTDQSVDTGTRIWQSIVNALIFLVMIVIGTTLLIVLYKYRFYLTIKAWLIISTISLLFFIALMNIAIYLDAYNIPLDWITMLISIWNVGALGMICIHWKGPLILQQAYLILVSAMMALLMIKSLPDWTVWTVLVIVSIWDLVAVLSPMGPLRILVETAQKRNEPIFPALIYSSAMIWEYSMILGMASNNDEVVYMPRQHDQTSENPRVSIIQPNLTPQSNNHRNEEQSRGSTSFNLPRSRQPRNPTNYNGGDIRPTFDNNNPDTSFESQCFEEEKGVKLGLGDFIFYSLLVGKTSSYGDWTITIACYVAILVGLCLTLSLLTVFRKALPALPISIAISLGFYFLSSLFIMPFASRLTIDQIFV